MTPSNPKPGEGQVPTPYFLSESEHNRATDEYPEGMGPSLCRTDEPLERPWYIARFEDVDGEEVSKVLDMLNAHACLLASNAEMRRLLRQVVRGNVEDVLEEIRAALARHPEKEGV